MSRVYVYVHSWIEDYETHGEDVVCVSPNLYPPSKQYPAGDGTMCRADYVEVWEDEVCRGCAYETPFNSGPKDTWNFLSKVDGIGDTD